jgi:hypothetical protein
VARHHAYDPAEDQTWGTGTGNWPVKYHEVSTTFWKLVERHDPVAILTFTRDAWSFEWLFELGVRNNKNALSDGPPPFRGDKWKSAAGQWPYIGGAANDPAKAAGRPNQPNAPIPNNPPDTTIAACTSDADTNGKRSISVGSAALVTQIKADLLAAFPMGPLVTGDSEMGNYPDNYVSSFVGYHAVWYQSFKPTKCLYAFHTHVGYKLSLADCKKAFCIQLVATIKKLGGTVTQPCAPSPPPPPPPESPLES